MKNIAIGTALCVSCIFTANLARAGCSDPRISAQSEAIQAAPLDLSSVADAVNGADPNWTQEAVGERIVGTWHVTYFAGGVSYAQAFIQWHSDKTEWENITMPVLNGNICLGSWKVVDKSHAFRNHVGWLFTNGINSGYFTETETVEVAHDGKSYTGVNETKLYQMDGTLIADIPGTSSAKRIQP